MNKSKRDRFHIAAVVAEKKLNEGEIIIMKFNERDMCTHTILILCVYFYYSKIFFFHFI